MDEKQSRTYNFAVIGVGGYVAPKHLKAIKETGNNLIAALDRNDSVGILDSFSYETAFFTEFERFDRHAEKLRRLPNNERIHYVSICSPNYLHDAHIRFALRIGAHAICEKPLVLNPWNLESLKELEQETGKNVFTVLQLRSHPAIKKLRMAIAERPIAQKHEIVLTYITSRGNWYFNSWKGVQEKSGGITTNIGIHFFDMLIWIFGAVQSSALHLSNASKASGHIELETASVRWFLSVDRRDLPGSAVQKGVSTFRSITVDGDEIEFSGGFSDLHTMVYREILEGKGYGVDDARPSIELVSNIRSSVIDRSKQVGFHPFLKQDLITE
ncbi:MAG: Gfo/Idh/MocA family oxidoreductase [Pseudomonadota bacterium]